MAFIDCLNMCPFCCFNGICIVENGNSFCDIQTRTAYQIMISKKLTLPSCELLFSILLIDASQCNVLSCLQSS